MRLIQFTAKGSAKIRVGILAGESWIIDLNECLNRDELTMRALLSMDDWEAVVHHAAKSAAASSGLVAYSDVTIYAPVHDVDKVICIGMNYADHCHEQNFPIPTEPIVFSKFGSTIIAPGQDIIKENTDKLDFEVELAVVMGKRCKNVSAKDAYTYIAGYSVSHDVSARDWQLERNGKQWLLGKTMDTFCPLGPALVLKDEILDPHCLNLGCTVNGVTVQDSNTRQLCISIPAIVEWCSNFMTLQPGDVILTGTPPGVGCFRKPPMWLKDGDEITCWVEKIGSITNKVRESDVEKKRLQVLAEKAKQAATKETEETKDAGASAGGLGKTVLVPNFNRFAGKSVVVTGGASGIGAATVEQFILEGANVAIFDIDEEKGTALAQSLNAQTIPLSKGQASFFKVDVSNPVLIRLAVADYAAKNKGQINYLFNNAVCFNSRGIDFKPEEFDVTFRVNVTAYALMVQAVQPFMLEAIKQQGLGVCAVVNNSSISAHVAQPDRWNYAASKGAIGSLTKCMAYDLGASGIRVNSLAPAWIWSPEVLKAAKGDRKKWDPIWGKFHMLRRCGDCEEVASVVLFLCSKEASFITGSDIPVDGGYLSMSAEGLGELSKFAGTDK